MLVAGEGKVVEENGGQIWTPRGKLRLECEFRLNRRDVELPPPLGDSDFAIGKTVETLGTCYIIGKLSSRRVYWKLNGENRLRFGKVIREKREFSEKTAIFFATLSKFLDSVRNRKLLLASKCMVGRWSYATSLKRSQRGASVE